MRLEIVRYLLNRGANADAVNRYGRTSLYNSMRHMHIDISQLLIMNKANINHADDYGETPLNEAVLQNNLLGVRLLLQHGVVVNAKDSARGNNTALHLAAEMGDVKMVIELLNAGANVNEINGIIYSDSLGTYTPLHNYAILNTGKARSVLEAQGFRIGELCASEINGGGNYTPLHLAALRGHKSIYNLLIKANADPGLKDSCGCTAEDFLKEYEDFSLGVAVGNSLRPN
jgi:ankyrin repeat protein